MSVNDYIQNLDLKDVAARSPFGDLESALGPMRSGEAAEDRKSTGIPDDLAAAVDVGSLLSFVAGISPIEKNDVLYSVQLAQRGASGQFDRCSQTEDWYRKYIEILEVIGWAGEQFAFSQYEQKKGKLQMDQAALAIIKEIATGSQLTVITKALWALKSLSEGDNPITLFDFNASAEGSGNFQIGAVQKAEDNGALSMAIGAFHFSANDNRRRFLFWSWGDQEVTLWTSANKMTLNTTMYAEHRETIRKKLGENADEYIEALSVAI